MIEGVEKLMRGKFITFEGPEGSGKTTQARRLVERLEGLGFEVLYTREPGGTSTGELIRNILQHDAGGEPICAETEVLLFAASRAQLVRHVILPALKRGAHVVCDRFADSTTAYQGFGRGFPIEQMLAINSFAIQEAVPDLSLLLDLEVEEGMRRIGGRSDGEHTGRDRIERESLAFHHRVRNGYLDLAGRWPDRFHLIDAEQESAAVETLVWKKVSDVIGC